MVQEGSRVMDVQTSSRLQNLIRREGRSLLQYASESFPWGTSRDAAAIAQILDLARAESARVTALARQLIKQRVPPPYLGAYPMYFTTLNFLALDRLLPLLVEHQQTDLAHLEEDLKHVQDGAFRPALQQLLELKRQHLKQLETLRPAASSTQPSPAG
jgi:hypothetical protein